MISHDSNPRLIGVASRLDVVFRNLDRLRSRAHIVLAVAALLGASSVPLSASMPLVDVKAFPQLDENTWNAVVAHPGFVPGDGGQYQIDADQCYSVPEVIYTGQDTGGMRKSFDLGQTWYTLPNYGLHSNFINGVAVDPLNPDRVLIVTNKAWNTTDIAGVYLTTNGGKDWSRKVVNSYNTDRGKARLVGYARSTMNTGSNKTLRAYCIILAWDFKQGSALGTNHELWTSADGGDSWTKVRDLAAATYGGLRQLRVSPDDPGVVYIAGGNLWRLENATSPTGAITKLSGSGGYPNNEGVDGTLYISDDGQTLLSPVSLQGIYKSTDGGDNWTHTFTLTTGRSYNIHINPYSPGHMVMFFAKKPYPSQQMEYSTNGNSASPTFQEPSGVEAFPGDTGDPALNESYIDAQWLSDAPGTVVVHAQTKWFRSTDGGDTWSLSSAGFNGRNQENFRSGTQFFDPTDADRFIMPMVDYGLRYTDTRGRWFKDNPITGAMNGGASPTCNGGAIDPDPSRHNILIACSQKAKQMLFRSTDDGDTVTLVSSAQKRRQFTGFDQDDPHYAFSADEKSTDYGATWSAMSFLTNNDAVVWDMTYNATGMASGQALFAVDVNGTFENVWRSVDRGANWTLVLDTSSVANGAYSLRESGLSVNTPFKVHPSDPDTIWTFDPTKQKLRKWDLSSGTPTNRPHTDTTLPGTLPAGFTIQIIDVDVTVPSVRYVLGDTDNSGTVLWRSTDSGANWTNLSNDFVGTGYNSIAISPVTGEVILDGNLGMVVIPPPYSTSNTIASNLPWGHYNVSYDNSVPGVTTSSLPGMIAGESYSQTLTASGGDGALVWTLDSGSLPAGLSLSSGGVISGVASTTGTANFTVRVGDSDAFVSNGDESTKALSIVVTANSVPAITTTTLPAGAVGSAYSQSLGATGGDGTLTWSVDSGSLPAGLSLSSGGVISGTPTTQGASSFTVRVADGDGVTGGGDEDTQALGITVGMGIFSGDQDIGSPGMAGSASYNSGTGVYTVAGGGSDIYGTSDKFHFVNQSWDGDVRLIARVDSLSATKAWAKSGLMIRDSAAADSRNVDFILSLSHGTQLTHRATAAGTTTSDAIVAGPTAPYWLKLERHGNVFTGWQSPDGLAWYFSGAATTTLNSTGTLVGLSVTANDNTLLNTSEFSNVSVTDVPAWTDADIGSDTGASATTIDYTTDTYTMNGAGPNIYGTTDSFRFNYLAWTGDATLICDVLSVQNITDHSKGGLMIRKSLAANSAHATIDVQANFGIEFLRRTTDGASTSNTVATGLTAPYFLKLVRSGDSFSAYYSTDGGTWTQLGTSVTISMSGTVYVGLVSCATSSTTSSTATFESVYIK